MPCGNYRLAATCRRWILSPALRYTARSARTFLDSTRAGCRFGSLLGSGPILWFSPLPFLYGSPTRRRRFGCTAVISLVLALTACAARRRVLPRARVLPVLDLYLLLVYSPPRFAAHGGARIARLNSRRSLPARLSVAHAPLIVCLERAMRFATRRGSR